jgi:hypothetical protein
MTIILLNAPDMRVSRIGFLAKIGRAAPAELRRP